MIVAARTNTTAPTSDLDLASLNGVVTVQAMDATGTLQTASSVADPATDVAGPGVDVLGTSENFAGTELVSGTSPASNIVGGFLADLKSKYPKATGNQLIQSLLRNTGDGQHALTKDPQNFFGYGIVSLRQMVKVDPTTYPDVNPLLSTDAAATPTYEQITGHAPGAATPTASARPSSGLTPSTSTLVPVLIIGGIAVILVVAAIIVLVVVLSRRSRRTRPVEPPRL